ncbi:MAG: hypothetical protein ABR884_04065 [Minisyncoccia bacterium]|jgi:hypothetical protein
MKKSSKGILFLWVLIVAAVAGGTFLLAEHLGVGSTPGGEVGPAAAPDVDVATDDSAASGATAAAMPMQNFSNSDDGYAFSVPANWNIEKTGSDTVAVHPDASSSVAACKLEVSAFPYSAGADGIANWIAHRIGADPSVAVTEQSSGNVALAAGGSGVEWIGTIDGLPTTLVYAFNGRHAYEIAPSVVGEGAAGDVQCSDMLQSFLSTLKI